jgi:ketosteroid isomerase-like protein
VSGEGITAETIAGRIEVALGAGDLAGFGALLSPDVQWGAPDDPNPTCRNREQVMTWYGRGWDAGTRARVTEVTVHGDTILVGMMVKREGEYNERWQILTVGPGGITDIRGFEDRRTAASRIGI